MQEANLGSEWLNYRLDEAHISAIDNLGNVLVPETVIASGRTSGDAEANAWKGIAPIMPTALEEDTLARRVSLFSMNTRCPGEELGRDCPAGALPKKGKVKRKT
ncbi:hypothetical protein [Granulicella sibirica]|nr:hypothetical protein [Granulicella sibirica]